MGFLLLKSGKRDSDSRPQPWQGCALPTELLPLVNSAAKIHFFFIPPRFCKIFFQNLGSPFFLIFGGSNNND